MKLTKANKRKIVQLLKKARAYYAKLENPGRYTGLCISISRCYTRSNEDAHVFLMDLIDERLGACAYYPKWISRNHAHLLSGLSDFEIRSKVRQGRLAWFDALIKEFSE